MNTDFWTLLLDCQTLKQRLGKVQDKFSDKAAELNVIAQDHLQRVP